MIKIRKMLIEDAKMISEAFNLQGWHKTKDQYMSYVEEQNNGIRDCFIALSRDEFAGYLTVHYQPDYIVFAKQNMPEIMDLNTLIKYQKQGVGTALINHVENHVKEKYKKIGLRVGLIKDYGNAQKLYVKLGYIPDGLGISKHNHFYDYFEEITADDDLVLGFVKDLK